MVSPFFLRCLGDIGPCQEVLWEGVCLSTRTLPMLESSARFYRHLVAEVADGAERIV